MDGDIFPLDEQLGLARSGFSPEFSQQMVWLSALLPYAQCEQVLARIGERYVSASSIWHQTQTYGEALQAAVEHQQECVGVERIQLPDARHDHDQRKGVSLDGGMVNIRAEGWREVKVGAVYDVTLRRERNPQTGELDELPQGVNVHYTAVLGSKERFTPALWALAVAQHVPTARNRSVVADGALWIWEVAEDVCPDGRQVVDWFHATQHLAEAAAALYPNDKDAKQRQRWLKTYRDHLYMGRVHLVIRALKRRQRADLATYFERHQRRMQYLEFREEGIPIGSGTVESGVKQYKQRLSASGMRWKRDHAERMLVIRSAVLSNEFDALWQQVA